MDSFTSWPSPAHECGGIRNIAALPRHATPAWSILTCLLLDLAHYKPAAGMGYQPLGMHRESRTAQEDARQLHGYDLASMAV